MKLVKNKHYTVTEDGKKHLTVLGRAFMLLINHEYLNEDEIDFCENVYINKDITSKQNNYLVELHGRVSRALEVEKMRQEREKSQESIPSDW